MNAILGTFVTVRTLADGTPRITLDLQCSLADISALGTMPGDPYGLARITPEAAKKQAQEDALQELADQAQELQMGYPTQQGSQKEEKSSVGPICLWACQHCKGPGFYEYILPIYREVMGGGIDVDLPQDEFCEHAIKVLFDIESRKELDTNPEVKRRFQDELMKPWSRSPLNPHREWV